ncbi:hypothetical protein PYCCODRAFT_287120 [Trametes coccinea BRFM310]|uniref:F-box domain-containing protein n=1 Tax=Trametes coccinea (strain BRFM310) TaxID=1353009 RepID=A0A1Y2IQS5_TRAC3|nr:hypothetical protein PYCCODRAFT_287120 [Trametes coccinea BRFM310]
MKSNALHQLSSPLVASEAESKAEKSRHTSIEGFPLEILERIFKYACLDGGPTGCSLSRTSKAIRAASRTTRFLSVILDANDPDLLEAFLALYSEQSVATYAHRCWIRHLHFTMPRYANTVDNAPRFAGARRLFHAVSDGLYTLAIHSDGQIPSHHGNPVITCHFPVLRELSVVPLANPSIIPGLDEDIPSEPLFPAVTHLQLGSYTIARWVDHAPRSTHLLVQDLKYWDCPNIMDNLTEVLGFSPADFPPFGKVNTQPALTHPHLRRVALEMPLAPAHDNSGEDSHLYVGLWFALTRLANYSGYVGFKFTLLDDRKELPTPEERRDRFKTQWLDRIQGGPGCWAETGTLSAGAAAEAVPANK